MRGPLSLTGVPKLPLAVGAVAAAWPRMTIEVSTGRAFAKLIVRLVPVATYGTVIRGGCQVVPPSCAVPSKPVHVAPVAVPHTQPHMGTALPSGRVAVWRVAVRVTWANDMLAVRRRITTETTVLIVALT